MSFIEGWPVAAVSWPGYEPIQERVFADTPKHCWAEEKIKGSDPVYFHQQADLDVMTGLSPNKALHLTLRVVSTAPRMVIR